MLWRILRFQLFLYFPSHLCILTLAHLNHVLLESSVTVTCSSSCIQGKAVRLQLWLHVCILFNSKVRNTNCGLFYQPELSMGFPAGTGSGSLISTTTTSDVRKVFATDAACSKQHRTTWHQHTHISPLKMRRNKGPNIKKVRCRLRDIW